MSNVFRHLTFAAALVLAYDFASAQSADPPADLFSKPLSPEASLREIVVRPGLRVELVAAEPLVVDPIAIAWGADGRMWVVEMRDYPLGLDGQGKPGGRIKILQDDDGDGRYDKAATFLDELQYPTAVLPWRDGAIICSVPEIFFAADTDGDGRADRRETLYEGLKVGNSQHLANGLRWGQDGWIHCANGATNTSVRSVKTGASLNVGTRDFRIHPETGGIEPLAGRSQYVRECDDFGNWFGSMNSEPLFHFVLEEQYLKRNPHAVYPAPQQNVPKLSGAAPVVPVSRTVTRFNDLNKAGRFTSACGITIYRDRLLGDEFYGNAFVCEPVHNLVHREVMERDGATFRSRRAADEQQSEFLASRDPWFRPTMARTGPDGALYVVDMYRLVIEHPEWIPKDWQAKLDLRAGSDRGRIYRVLPEKGEARKVSRIDKLDVAELVALLGGPNGTLRDLAMQRLMEDRSEATTLHLQRMAPLGRTPAGRVAMLNLLAERRKVSTPVMRTMLDDSSPEVRAAAIAAAPTGKEHENLEVRLVMSIGDADPLVRNRAALRLDEVSHPYAIPALGRLFVDPKSDPNLTACATSSLQSGKRLAQVVQVAFDEVGLLKRSPTDTIAALVDTIAGYDDRASLALLIRAAAEAEPTTVRFEAAATLLDGLARHRLDIARLQKGTDDGLPDRARELLGVLDEARRAADDSMLDVAARAAALELFGREPSKHSDELAIVGRLLTPRSADALRAAAIAAAVRFGTSEAVDLLIAGWSLLPTKQRPPVIEACLTRPTWTERLLAAVGERRIAASDIDVTNTQRLLNHRDPKLREAANRVFAAAVDPDRAAVVAKYVKSVSAAGDATRGRALFTKSCGPCHKIGDVGHAVGPDLTALSDRSPPSLLTSIFDPNRAIESKYVGYTAVTDAGLTYTGLLVAETDATVTLVGNDGKQQVLRRDELEEFVATGRSLMPIGVEKDVSPEGASDLLAFLAVSRTPPKSFAGNEPRLVKPEALRGELYLTADAAEAYGETLTYATAPRRWTTWRSASDRVEWEFEITAAGSYEVSIEYGRAERGGIL